jgi:hypothetical protein
MRLFDQVEATHFCKPLTAAPGGAAQSLSAFLDAMPPGTIRLSEGTQRFDVHRVNLLNSVERWLLYSLGHYRRAMDMFVPASAPWAQVTLYYSAFFAANALLGMFGGWIGQARHGNYVVEVERGAPGHQQFRIHRGLRSPSGTCGSHREFWDFFYDSCASLVPWAPPHLGAALQPVNNDFAWQIVNRNEVNYDMFHAWNATTLFHNTFQAARYRRSLSGPLALQLEATERLIRIASHFADTLSVFSFGLAGCGLNGARAQVQRRLVKQAPPGLIQLSELPELLGER